MALISTKYTFHCYWKSSQIVIITAMKFSKEVAIQTKRREKKGNSSQLVTSIEIIAKKTIVFVIVAITTTVVVVVTQMNPSAIVAQIESISANKVTRIVSQC